MQFENPHNAAKRRCILLLWDFDIRSHSTKYKEDGRSWTRRGRGSEDSSFSKKWLGVITTDDTSVVFRQTAISCMYILLLTLSLFIINTNVSS